MKNFCLAALTLLGITSCASLNSTTFLKPNNTFVLGKNEHGAFQVNLKNTSPNTLSIYQAPLNGGKHSTLHIKPNQRASLKVDKNTALVISNPSPDTASVRLRVTGDLGLSMTYNK
ncbi:hypothetical protein ACFSC6_22490 [Rufibacter sediminis]|uniref:Lipoprotein n=1 Tax=Rufibacter sediminis TaxID=2762756 RepID=A0ABR6VUR7_9BACT|nr:hypothetical protein [Rufibacter sediminis]MBC3540911.1 hypothetical protein [Rufibacter sediminis]